MVDGKDIDVGQFLRDASDTVTSIKRERNVRLEEELKSLMASSTAQVKRRIAKNCLTGPWLTAEPNTLNGTELTCDEFRDSLRIRLGLTPLGLQARCDGCNQRFTVGHAMQCKIGGLVRFRHEEVASEWHQLLGLLAGMPTTW